ncbi:MAG: hypothetical protein K2K10_06155, partial [Acetatifactor sp.]|nr:hypothetical protein [Acetatifactor sp.]
PPPISTPIKAAAASDVYKIHALTFYGNFILLWVKIFLIKITRTVFFFKTTITMTFITWYQSVIFNCFFNNAQLCRSFVPGAVTGFDAEDFHHALRGGRA